MLFLSSTWGRADQQTSQDSNRVWGVLFCARKSIPALNSPLNPFTRWEPVATTRLFYGGRFVGALLPR